MGQDEELPVDERNEEGPSTTGSNRHWLILNPTSGTADHVEQIRHLATDRGYRIEETEEEEHAVKLAEAAAADAVDVLAVAGGDGTVHEAVQGLVRGDALDDVTLGVIPTGTENIFATNIGVQDIEQGFNILETGERRRIDIGIAGDEPFVMSCIAGLPADASVATSSALKERFGSLAFVIAGLQEVATFEELHLEINAISQDEETTWTGEALCVLVGNIRRFAKQGGQANVEDGLFDVVIIERMPGSDLVAETVAQRVLGQDTKHVLHVQASQLEIDGQHGESIDFSLDGELSAHKQLALHTRPHALTVCVGPEYDLDPIGE
ncbi:diacylglycerol/lipid kinase family protein [Haladaptatus halobius]|uniref:diacylglycerol/lipid kinase family protein n=1 Tax=Haladaptatus halobius TaxID=2884875 RepID=UPI001D0B54B2|nr:YegS/Rv2252/BmrU family lipid kinase [Haladaptatus halobius]